MIRCNSSDTDLINISGICRGEDINFVQPNPGGTPPLVGTNNWIQLNINEELIIPYQKPNIEEINSLSLNVNIIRKKVIVTPNSNGVENAEGKLVTGRKLIVEGELCEKVVYTACEKEQPIHSAHFYIPFSAYIVLPKEITFPNGLIKDSLFVNFLVNTCIEDAYIQRYTERNIYNNITLLLQAIPSANKIG